jgi:hypothetical protein
VDIKQGREKLRITSHDRSRLENSDSESPNYELDDAVRFAAINLDASLYVFIVVDA